MSRVRAPVGPPEKNNPNTFINGKVFGLFFFGLNLNIKPGYRLTLKAGWLEEEAGRLDGIPGVMPKNVAFFEIVASNDAIWIAYEVMQVQYVLSPEDRIEHDATMSALYEIHDILMTSWSWILYEANEYP